MKCPRVNDSSNEPFHYHRSGSGAENNANDGNFPHLLPLKEGGEGNSPHLQISSCYFQQQNIDGDDYILLIQAINLSYFT